MATKYIRNQSRFVVFPNSSQHRQTAIKGLGPDKLIHGAGFMRLIFDGEKIQAECYGHSESLNKVPRRDDHIHILNSIGVENDSEVQYAKYVILRGKAVVFCNELNHKEVAEGAFYGSTNCESAGLVKFLVHPSGKIKIECLGESTSLGVSSNKEDYKAIAQLMEIREELIFNSSSENTNQIKMK
jgi:hypothetical protein